MYNYLGEVSVLILSGVLFFNTLSSFSFREKKNVYFLLCLLSVIFSTFTNIVSINLIEHFDSDRILFSTIATTAYFISLGLTPFFFACYCYAFVAADKKYGKIFAVIYVIPIVFYFMVLVLNTKYNLVFRYDEQLGYTRGSLKNITYITTAIYSFLVLSVVFCYRKTLSRHMKIVFVLYPFVALLISAIQFLSTYSVMTGTSSFATLLLVYLSIQSDMLEYDLQTGLLTERHLEKFLNKKAKGYVAVFSIENYTRLESAMSVYNLSRLKMEISQALRSLFGRHSYYISVDRFAIFSNDFVELKGNVTEFLSRFVMFKLNDNSVLHVDFIAACIEFPTNADSYDTGKTLINGLFARLRSTKEQRVVYCQQRYVDEIKRANKIYEILDRELTPESSKFQVHFQPIYSVQENRCVFVEALARLKDTELGDIMPMEFISIAEERGLIGRLGNLVFEKVCAFLTSNKSVNAVSINFSASQMLDPNICDYVIKTISRHGVDPGRIIAEITESVFIEDFEVVHKNMMRLSGYGIKFYLDDFGVGYSNFANVVTLPFRAIKIDRSFIPLMQKKREVQNFIKSLIRTFKENGLNILVEGVETQDQDIMVKEAEVDFVQGFYYSYPMPQEELLKCI